MGPGVLVESSLAMIAIRGRSGKTSPGGTCSPTHPPSACVFGKNDGMTATNDVPSQQFESRRRELGETYLRTGDDRPASSGRGVHHTALVSGDVDRTIRFYQELLEF